MHRWCGLFTAAFLCVAGLTGAVIAWDHELDAWLNPEFFGSRGGGMAIEPLGGKRALFDLHRSGGVWLWPLLLVLALSAVAMNLGDQVVRPAVGLFSRLTPSPIPARAGEARKRRARHAAAARRSEAGALEPGPRLEIGADVPAPRM